MSHLSKVELFPTTSFSSHSTSSEAYGSIQSKSLDDADVLLPKYVQSPACVSCYGTCTQLQMALRFKDIVLEQKFVKEQYQTACFMRAATVFGVIQILIAPSIFYDPLFLTWSGFFDSNIFRRALLYVSLCVAGGFLLTVFSRLSRTHDWWNAVGTSSAMLTFCGYYLYNFVFFLLYPGGRATYEQGRIDRVSECNETMFNSSVTLLTKLNQISSGNQSALNRYDFGFVDNTCLLKIYIHT